MTTKIQRTILDRIETLAEEPCNQGKKLVRSLAGFCSGRYRAIYKIEARTVVAYILAAGIRKEGDRKDIYQIVKKLLKAGLLS